MGKLSAYQMDNRDVVEKKRSGERSFFGGKRSLEKQKKNGIF